MRNIVPFILVLLVCLALSGKLFAQQNEEEVNDYLDTVFVSADRSAETVREVSQSVNVVTEDTLNKAPTSEIADVLTRYGIQINHQDSQNSGNTSITIRGFSTSTHGNDLFSNILILIDGHRVGTDSLFIVPYDMIERIEVIRGPGSVMYGSAGMGGVVNIITKRGEEDLKIRVESGIGSYGQVRDSISVSKRVGQFDIAGAVGYSTVNNYEDPSGNQVTNTGMDYKINYFLNLGWNFNDYHRIGLTVIGSNLNNAGSGDGNGASSLNFPYRGKPYYDEQTKKLTNISLTYEGKTADGSKEWLARYFAGKSDYDTYQRFGELEPGNPSEFTSTFGKNDFQGAQAQFAWDFDIVKIVTGVDWLQYKVTQTQPVIPSQPSTRKNDTQSKYTNIGVFLLGRLRLLAERNLVFSFGVRHDETDVDIQLERTNYSRHDKRKFSKTIPSAGLSYSPLDYLKFRLNYGQAFVTPTPRNLVGNFYMGSTLFLGNPNLEPEKSATWEGGFDIDYEGVTSSFTYFYTKYDNYIGTLARQTIDGQTGTLYINIKDVTISGFEASFAVDFGRLLGWEFKLEPYVNWTHLEKFEDSIGRKLPSLNQDAASFGVDFNYPKFDLSAGLSATYYGRPDSTSFSSGTKPAQRGGAMVYDLSLTKGLINFTDNQGISLKVSVRNMFNKEYDIINNLDQPGRNFYIALVYNYK